jgi:asparagine synthetase B (glutamine-hydrolysing)
MCGIAAIHSNDQNILGNIDKIIKKINYRGPDDIGSLELKNNFSVGSCRLSIFDISEKAKCP